MGNLLRAACGEGNGVMWTDLLSFETVVLDGVELFANRTCVLLAGVADSLEESAMDLCPLSQAFVHQG